MPLFTKFRRWLTPVLLVLFGLGIFTYSVQAVFPGSFWRIVQIAERLAFLYGGVDNPTEYLSLENDGRVGIGTIPTNASAILELKSEDKALLVTRINTVAAIATPENGMIVYEGANTCFKVYQDDEWSACLGTAGGIRVLPSEPPEGSIGDVYFNTTNNTLFIHNGDRFVAVTANFLELVAYNYNCTKHALVDPSLQLRCPNNKQITSLFYETATFSDTTDNHSIPEVEAVECCQTTYHPFYWHTTDWGTCVGGSQSRTVSCRDVNDNVVDSSLCIAAHEPPTTQTCDEPSVPVTYSWRTGAFGACVNGTQSRTVECINDSTNEVAVDSFCSASTRPAESQSCTDPLGCTIEDILRAGDTDTPLQHLRPYVNFDSSDGSTANDPNAVPVGSPLNNITIEGSASIFSTNNSDLRSRTTNSTVLGRYSGHDEVVELRRIISGVAELTHPGSGIVNYSFMAEENGINGTRISNDPRSNRSKINATVDGSATAQQACAAFGFRTVLGANYRRAFRSPYNNDLTVYNPSTNRFFPVNAKDGAPDDYLNNTQLDYFICADPILPARCQ